MMWYMIFFFEKISGLPLLVWYDKPVWATRLLLMCILLIGGKN